MEASNKFTRKAQESADRMEKITVNMHEIAKKTKQETVSMKIITVVTLFFLPGTFISVSLFAFHH
jgi:Mg2+ and Co2+ transporter CorA